MRRDNLLLVMLSLIMALMVFLPAAAFDTGENDDFFSGDVDEFTGACLKAYVLNAMLGFDGFASVSETDDMWIFLGGIPGEFQYDSIYITVNKQTGEEGILDPLNEEDFEILMAAVPLEIPEPFIGKESTFELEPPAETAGTAVENPAGNEAPVESSVCPTPQSCADESAGTCAERCGGNNACLEHCLRAGSGTPMSYSTVLPIVDDGLPKMSDAFITDMGLLAEEKMLGTTAYDTSYIAYPYKITVTNNKLKTFSFMSLPPLNGNKNAVIHFNLGWESGPDNTDYGQSNCGMFARWGDSGYVEFWIDQAGAAGIYSWYGRNGESHDDNSFGPEAASGSMPVTILLTDSNAAILCDGKVCAFSNSIPLPDPGYWQFLATSGTESGFGTRCEYSDIEILTFE